MNSKLGCPAETIMLTEYEEARRALRSRDACPAERPLTEAIVGGTVSTLGGEDHRTRKQAQAPIYSRESLWRYEQEIMVPRLHSMVTMLRGLERRPDGKVHTDLVPIARDVNLSIAAAVIGFDNISYESRRDLLTAYMDELIEGTLENWSSDNPNRPKVLATARATLAKLDAHFLQPVLHRRRADDYVPSGRPDLIGQMMSSPGVEDRAILRECALYLVAAVYTTAAATTQTINELDGWLSRHPERRDLVHDVAFLRRAAEEALRLHSGIPWSLRRAANDITVGLPTGQLNKGSLFAIDFMNSSRDPGVYGSDADVFDVDRTVRAGANNYGHSFGGGSHLCSGLPLVLGGFTAGSQPVSGTLPTLLRALYGLGVRRDHDEAARKRDYQDAFVEYPVVFDL